MRKLLHLLIVLLLIPACVPQPQKSVRSLLREGEAMLRTCPDTAYLWLQEIGASGILHTTADSAYHALLLLEAQQKNGVTKRDTISLGLLETYFQEQHDTLMLSRLWQLRAQYHASTGDYPTTVRLYRKAIALVEQTTHKRWMADMYYGLAKVHLSGALLTDADSCMALLHSWCKLTIQTAREIGDTVLWMNALRTSTQISREDRFHPEQMSSLLQALDLAVALKDRESEAVIALRLSVCYSQQGEKEKAFEYVQRNLNLREGSIPPYIPYLIKANTWEYFDKDSATYYRNKSRELLQKQTFSRLSGAVPQESEENADNRLTALSRWMKQHQQLEEQTRRTRWAYGAVGIVLMGGMFFYIRKARRYRKTEAERDELAHEIKELQTRLDQLSSGTADVLDKARRIIADFQYKAHSDQRMEEADWRLLQFEIDKQLDGELTRLRQEYQLTDTDIRLCCLILTDIPTSHMACLFERSRNNAYLKIRQLFEKLGVDRGSESYQQALLTFIEHRRRLR